MAILMVRTITHFHSDSHLTAVAALKQIDARVRDRFRLAADAVPA
jgi:hypothetical protein